MAIELNNQTVLIYNNVYLGNLIQAEAETTPVYGAMGEYEHSITRITIESIIPGGHEMSDYLVDSGTPLSSITPDYGSDRTDNVLNTMKLALSQPRKALYMLNSGFGNTILSGQPSQDPLTRTDIETFLNTTFDTAAEFPEPFQKQYDLKMGPIPKVLRWEPIGGRGACRLVFEIEVHTKECLLWYNENPIGRLCGFNYKTTYELDDFYLTRRKISGVVKMHQNVESAVHPGTGHEITQGSIDTVRDTVLLNFRAPDNFRRKRQSFTVNEDRSEMRFSLTDEQIDSSDAYPRDVLEIDLEQTAEGDGPAFSKWTTTLSGSITLKPKVAHYWAWLVFAQIAIARLARGYQYRLIKTKRKNGDITETVVHIASPIPTNMRIKESVFKQKARFDFSFTWTLFVYKPEDVFLATGLFTSISADANTINKDVNMSWANWKNSIIDIDSDQRGSAVLTDYPRSTIVNSCLSGSPNYVADQFDRDQSNYKSDEKPQNASQLNVPIFQNYGSEITEESSMIAYQNKVQLKTISNTLEYTCPIDPDPDNQLGKVGYDYYKAESGNEQLPKLSGGVASELLKQHAGSRTNSIEIAPPSVYLQIVGGARRFLGPTPSPEVLKVGGVDVECIQDDYESYKEDDSLNVPVYASSWSKVYRVLGSPTDSILTAINEVNPSS